MDTFLVPSDQTDEVREWCIVNAPSARHGEGVVSMDFADSFFFQMRWFPGCHLIEPAAA
ncbi:hypothetical protein [Brevundimonas sp. SGAir0440]|uniref:hypothetical protein n=1 Tax=Brevundimonas sp. SGAir0440 TaxID=2579977 RepID=UPI00143D0587|nr:hypothetical protein [Brevundimonas sp. SGAir0440]